MNAPTLSSGEADLLLVFDPLVALSPVNLKLASPARTVAIVSTAKVPTGAMVADRSRRYPSLEAVKAGIDAGTLAGENIYFDAQALAEDLLGDHLASNMLLVGAAYQKGAIPIPGDQIETAIRLNGTSVDMNIAAFRWGRRWRRSPTASRNMRARQDGANVPAAQPFSTKAGELAAPFSGALKTTSPGASTN